MLNQFIDCWNQVESVSIHFKYIDDERDANDIALGTSSQKNNEIKKAGAWADEKKAWNMPNSHKNWTRF